ncbi:uncharacterized protein M421DRAFT_7227 [Didymella exigua CBS 183.55]|uniref:Fungal N-terminal domain-containing protein n=1 Tax=Didymella exigua CBS 183.55 TaxID=1150837 RepID=A0A6A5RF26_9PLEO|nr:uncharacterized protein M421DRAFT_7227 [Didymella exigua CBS 183.55]KAF1926302.1 hypothetical protein M421DRAFT_7227 [Didymella exigua CBS 183.55]
MDPFSAGVFTSIGSAFKFADVAIRIAEVGSENAVFVRTICVVRSDLEEVERLLSEDTVQKKLTATPGKLPWIKTAIHNTRYALNEIGRWVERVRVEQESTGSIRFDTRVRWVFSDHEKLLSRKTELSTCHQQLSSILGYLVGLEVAPGHPAPQEYEDTTQFEDVLARHRRTNRPKPPKADSGQKSIAVKKGVLHDHAAANPVPNTYSRLPPVSGHRSPSNAALFNVHERDDSIRSPSFASSRKPTGSPPPTYATAVSVDSVTYDVRPSLYSPPMADKSTSADQGTDHKDTLNRPHNETWAYRSNLNDMAISELAGDAVVFSATNSAGPVNPYELMTFSKSATMRFCTSYDVIIQSSRNIERLGSHPWF